MVLETIYICQTSFLFQGEFHVEGTYMFMCREMLAVLSV